MRVSVSILGTEVLALDLNREQAATDGSGDSTAYPLGFTASHGDARWESSPELQ